MSALDRLDASPAPVMSGVQEAVVLDATLTGVRFTVPDYSTKVEFGPAPYPRPVGTSLAGADGHVHDILPTDLPPKGARCLVVFARGDIARPWVLQIIGWPA